MLEHLFGSKTRVKLLSLFLRHPDEPIFVRDLTRRIGTQINAVRRELLNLVRLGLVVEVSIEAKEEGGKKQPGLKRKYYQLNHQFALLAEIRSLILKSQVLLDRRLDQEIAKLGDVRFLALMGLFTGQVSKPPIDLFIVGSVKPQDIQSLLAEVEESFGLELNFSLMATDEYKYRKDIGDRFLHGILESPKKVVIDRLSERG